jgi:hypothetical protein
MSSMLRITLRSGFRCDQRRPPTASCQKAVLQFSQRVRLGGTVLGSKQALLVVPSLFMSRISPHIGCGCQTKGFAIVPHTGHSLLGTLHRVGSRETQLLYEGACCWPRPNSDDSQPLRFTWSTPREPGRCWLWSLSATCYFFSTPCNSFILRTASIMV